LALRAGPPDSVDRYAEMAKTQAEKQKEARREKLAQIRKDIKSGNLVVRQMTKAERKKYPPKKDEKRAS
jgi:anti-sigma28 factor (negative regulator of flagellin synthesis)